MNLTETLANQILIFDGAYGTAFQALCLGEEAYRNDALAGVEKPLKGNHEVLNITKPEAVAGVHRDYIEACSRIITANTFNANAISQADYGLETIAPQMAAEAVKIALAVAAESEEKVWVAGSLGPTNKTLSIGADVENPHLRSVSFDEVSQAYYDQIEAMVEAGVEIILIETIFDTLNAKAAIVAYQKYFEQSCRERLPLWISVTITDKSGRTLSGQTLKAFVASVMYAQPTIMGLNCAMGATDLIPYVQELSELVPCAVAVHPNAGLPNELGGYDQTPEQMAEVMGQMTGCVNIVGGCCGTMPEHIAALAKVMADKPARALPESDPMSKSLNVTGLEPFCLPRVDAPFALIGERTNVAGSPKFAKLAKAGDLAGAVEIARQQVQGGANMIDVCFDDAMLDAKALMGEFLRRLSAEPDIAAVPVMIDSSDAEVLEEGLKSTQGKCVVNSLSLKEGEADFLKKAAMVRRYGVAAVVMAFDEDGQAVDIERRVAICKRAYALLTANGYNPDDIIFDLNILTIGTGMAEHANYAADFIKAIVLVKEACPGARVSGGLSNLSFAFRGQRAIREALHAVFLYHAIAAGLDMAIVAAGMLTNYDSIDPQLRELCEALIFNNRESATEELLAYAAEHAEEVTAAVESKKDQWRELSLEERMSHALMSGLDGFVVEDAQEALQKYESALEIIEGPLMDGMRKVGDLFGEGKMFLPQVVKSARVMKAFVAQLQPTLEAQKTAQSKPKKILLATVKGDVHDIGKNIVGVVLDCNGYEVIDLGVMVPCEKIIEAIAEHQPDIVGLSGLITPSLHEMIANVTAFQKAGISLPVLIGGATTSRLHTAIKIDPCYDAGVVYVPDASRVVEVCQNLLGANAAEYIDQTKAKYAKLRDDYNNKDAVELVRLDEARAKAPELAEFPRVPNRPDRRTFEWSVNELLEYIDWSPFFWSWSIRGKYPKLLKENSEAQKLFDDAQAMLAQWVAENWLKVKGVCQFWPAKRVGDDVELNAGAQRFSFLRQQESGNGKYACLADFVSASEGDSLGGFVVSVPAALDEYAQKFKDQGDDYRFIMAKALGDRLVEAAAEYLHLKVRQNYGQEAQLSLDDLIAERYDGIRPAFGYPACPDHTQKQLLWDLLDATEHTGATLTSSFAMNPPSTVSGLYFHHAQSRYFNIKKISQQQLEDYSKRRGWSMEEAKRWLAPII